MSPLSDLTSVFVRISCDATQVSLAFEHMARAIRALSTAYLRNAPLTEQMDAFTTARCGRWHPVTLWRWWWWVCNNQPDPWAAR